MGFQPGSEIEVKSMEDGFKGAWFEANVLKHYSKSRRYTIQYASILSDEPPHKPLRDYICTRHIRPKQPRSCRSFKKHQLVEAMHNDAWWKGVITEIISTSSYRVCLPMSREEYVFKEEDVREQMDWVNGNWLISQDIMADDKNKYNVGTRVKVSIDKEEFGKKWCIGTVIKVIGKNFFLVKYDDVKVNEYNFVKSSEEIVDSVYIAQVQIYGQKRKSFDATTSTQHISAPTSSDISQALEFNKKHNGSEPTNYDAEGTSNEMETCVNSMKNQFVEAEPDILLVAAPKSNQTTVSDSDQIVRPQEVESTSINLKSTPNTEDCPPMDPSLSGSSLLGEVTLPFKKVSIMWEAVESMEVFKAFPQKPHFHALKQHELELRDGMAIGLMIAFANIVDSIKRMKIADSKYVFEEKLKALLPLELNGFNVEPLRFRLEKLLDAQSSVDQWKEKRLQIVELLAERDKEKDQLDISNEDNEKAIMDLEENLINCLKKREILSAEMEDKDCERDQLKMDLQANEEALVSSEKDFNAYRNAL